MLPAPAREILRGDDTDVVYYQVVDDKGTPPKFVAEYEFTACAYVPTLNLELVKPYDEESDEYIKFTAERAPHIVFTPDVKKLVKKIVDDETNPLKWTVCMPL